MKDLKKEIRRRIELKNLDLYNYSSFGEYVTCENDVIDLIAELLQEERQRTLEEVRKFIQVLDGKRKVLGLVTDAETVHAELSKLLSKGNEKE